MPPLPGSKDKTQLFKTLKEHVGNVEHHEKTKFSNYRHTRRRIPGQWHRPQIFRRFIEENFPKLGKDINHRDRRSTQTTK